MLSFFTVRRWKNTDNPQTKVKNIEFSVDTTMSIFKLYNVSILRRLPTLNQGFSNRFMIQSLKQIVSNDDEEVVVRGTGDDNRGSEQDHPNRSFRVITVI